MDKKIHNCFMLKNENGEDVYSFDIVDHALVVSPLRPIINILGRFTLFDNEGREIAILNIGEIFVNAIFDAHFNYLNPLNKAPDTSSAPEYYIPKKITNKYINAVLERANSVIMGALHYFRDPSDCFPDLTVDSGAYVPPTVDNVINYDWKREGKQ